VQVGNVEILGASSQTITFSGTLQIISIGGTLYANGVVLSGASPAGSTVSSNLFSSVAVPLSGSFVITTDLIVSGSRTTTSGGIVAQVTS
jgi:hypothetical protein